MSSKTTPATHHLLAVAICFASLTMLLVGSLSGQQPQVPTLSWPAGFSVGSSTDPAWVEHAVDSPGLRVRISVPPNWTRGHGNAPGDFVAMDVQAGRRLEIAETKASPFQYDKPLPSAQMQGSIKTMQASVPKGYVVEKAGQVRIGSQMWMWHESTIPTFDPATSTEYRRCCAQHHSGVHAHGCLPPLRTRNCCGCIALCCFPAAPRPRK